jgi:hypothetical protein
VHIKYYFDFEDFPTIEYGRVKHKLAKSVKMLSIILGINIIVIQYNYYKIYLHRIYSGGRLYYN